MTVSSSEPRAPKGLPLRLIALVAVAMLAFAGNSLLNRVALAEGAAGPGAFAALRLGSGAAMLWLLVRLRRGAPLPPLRRAIGPAAALALYMLGFSFAYLWLDAGLGALLLFGGVQITMFAGALAAGEPVPARRWAGTALAFAGLCALFWPGGGATPPLAGVGLMLAAAVGWGIYSLIGRRSADPLGATAANFLLAAGVALLPALLWPDGLTIPGAALALASGMITSALGYALWYAVLPQLPAAVAALAQLTVPVIAIVLGALLLSEPVTPRLIAACLLVLGGVGFGVWSPKRRE
ncbi:DMT family transporter [Poseidonocella sedimentorum]|uniref:Threonine/homoserine efflux transporter RhtA n=1 Tax=Poseidonocella sedimentorum TaxID=871652 RepID=A0A1I6CT67_9RHOB|nr:DMT family transporter [Poseidonocella sedimentorum]SFQ96359.1 Threonine/homoserine efflux transporter RhtA [Poseidonocella sedimentorum]